jgi:hypothetical protein
MLTGFLHGDLHFTRTDPGGMRSASFVVSQKLGFRTDMVMPYSRIYIYNQRNGDTVFEGDVSHPGRSVSEDGSLLEVQVEGGVERLNDWSGQRIFIDRDMTAWSLSNQSTRGALSATGDDLGGSGNDALTLSFPNSFHVEANYRSEVMYNRIREAGQQLGRINFSGDFGTTNASWLARLITSPPSTVGRAVAANLGGFGGSGAVVGGGIPTGANIPFLQFIWTSGPSSTGTADTVWVSLFDVVVVVRLHLKDGSFKTSGYVDWLTADQVWEDMLGDMLASSFDGPNASLDLGTGYNITQLAYPDGTTPMQVADALMGFETACTYMVGASNPLNGKYSLTWMSRSDVPRYEFSTWSDEHSGGPQAVEQYNEAVARWKAPTGVIRSTVTTQSIPEMTAVGRSRRYYQDLTETVSSATNATQANSTVLNDHRFPLNGGQVTVSRPVVDLWTGRTVQPFEIQPGYIARIVGVNPSRDALNNSPRNGSSLCRIVNTDYSAGSHSVSIDLDSVPYSMARAIKAAKPKPLPRYLRRPNQL